MHVCSTEACAIDSIQLLNALLCLLSATMFLFRIPLVGQPCVLSLDGVFCHLQ